MDIIDIGGYQAPQQKYLIEFKDDDGKQKQVNCEPFFVGGIGKILAAEKMVIRNPRDAGRAYKMLNEGALQIGAFARAMPAGARAVLHPIVQAASGPMMEAAKEAVRLRIKASHDLMKNPTQTIPLTLDSATAPGTFTAGASCSFVVQNPYIGSGGAIYNSQGIWAITAIETGGLVNIGGLLFTSAVFAGHDYVQAALGGIRTTTFAGGAAAPAVSGWDLSIFASDKRHRDHTTFSPWNLQGASGIIGSIMRETGTITLTIANLNNAAFAGGAVHVHVKASLCGSPFQSDVVSKMFVPFNQQLAASSKLAAGLPLHLAPLMHGLDQHATMVRGLGDELDASLAELEY